MTKFSGVPAYNPNVLTSSLNAVDMNYDILICVNQSGTRVLAGYC